MKTNDIFNLRRFTNYLLADGRSCFSNFGLDLLVYTFSGLGLYLFLSIFHLFGLFKFMSYTNLTSGVVFGFMAICVFATMGTKCYGYVTDKRSGSLYTLLPVSVLEKTFSIIIWSLVIPLLFVFSYLGIDWILSSLDSSYGLSLIESFFGLRNEFSLLIQEAATEGFDFNFISNPLIYLDDFLYSVLIFVLGALVFKKNKVAKTILTIIAVCMVFSGFAGVIFSQLFMHADEFIMSDSQQLKIFTDHLVLWDTISDQIVLLGISLAIFFRIKTIKH